MENKKILIDFDRDLLNRIEDYQFENRISSRAKAIRILLDKALTQEKEGGNV